MAELEKESEILKRTEQLIKQKFESVKEHLVNIKNLV